jgi:hypothetical protein
MVRPGPVRAVERARLGAVTTTAPPWSPTRPTTSSTAPCLPVVTWRNWRPRSRRRWAWSSTGSSSA